MAFDRRETTLLVVGDFCILVASLWVALLIRNLALPTFSYFQGNVVPFVPMFLISLAVFYVAGLYEKQTRPIRRVMGTRVFGAQVATVAIAAILFFILPFSIAPKTILVIYLIVSVIAVSMWRFYRMKREMKEENRVPVILVGSGSSATELYDEVNNNSKYMIRFVDRAEKNDQPVGEITAVDVASLYEEIFDRVPLEYLDAHQLSETLPKNRVLYDGTKRLFDVALAAILSVIALPLIALASLILYFENGAPFFTHERIGKGGKTFRLVKLRSMLLNDHGDSELQKKNRVTVIGKLLRKTRIDELPQLWNVLKGDLSFIGPRPELPILAEVYAREIPHYDMRHAITPGLSGWAQIFDYDAPRGGADVARTRRKLSFDLYYLKHRSLGLDLIIAVKTIRALLALSGT